MLNTSHIHKLSQTILFTFPIILFIFIFFANQNLVLSATAGHVVISEVQVTGATSTDEFIELYNPTNVNVDLTGWKVMKLTSSGTEEMLVATLTGNIKSYGFYLIANNTEGAGYDESVVADTTYSEESISGNNTVILRNADSGLVDMLGMGTAQTFEGDESTIANPIDNRSLERKALTTSDETSMASGGSDHLLGNGEDTNSNFNDFVRHVSPNLSEPQNSTSAIEIPGGSLTPTEEVSPTETVSITPSEEVTPTESATPTQTMTVSPTPTETLTVTPTASVSPTPTLTPTSSPTPTIDPTPTDIPSPTPTLETKVLGVFNFPRKTMVCTITYKPIQMFFSTFLMPRFGCHYIYN